MRNTGVLAPHNRNFAECLNLRNERAKGKEYIGTMKKQKKSKKTKYRKLFRTCMFGGYKKKDVRVYLERLEKVLAETEVRVLSEKKKSPDRTEKKSWTTYEAEKGIKEEAFGNVIVFGDISEN